MKQPRFAIMVAGLAAIAMLFTAVSDASAAVIYQDNFTGSGSAPLNGTTPTVTTGAATWWAESGWTADGAVSGGGQAYLPLTPIEKGTYTLSADLTVTSSGIDWIALGFDNNTGGGYFIGGGAAWMLNDGNGNVTAFTNGVSASFPLGNYGTNVPVSAKIVLNTMQPQWTAAWYVNGTQMKTVTFNTNPTIDRVELYGFSPVTGSVANFQLDFVGVPEPSTGLLLLVGGGLLAWWKRAGGRR